MVEDVSDTIQNTLSQLALIVASMTEEERSDFDTHLEKYKSKEQRVLAHTSLSKMVKQEPHVPVHQDTLADQLSIYFRSMDGMDNVTLHWIHPRYENIGSDEHHKKDRTFIYRIMLSKPHPLSNIATYDAHVALHVDSLDQANVAQIAEKLKIQAEFNLHVDKLYGYFITEEDLSELDLQLFAKQVHDAGEDFVKEVLEYAHEVDKGHYIHFKRYNLMIDALTNYGK